MVAHTFTWEAEAGGSMTKTKLNLKVSSRPTRAIELLFPLASLSIAEKAEAVREKTQCFATHSNSCKQIQVSDNRLRRDICDAYNEAIVVIYNMQNVPKNQQDKQPRRMIGCALRRTNKS